jgi:hypothetical protein
MANENNERNNGGFSSESINNEIMKENSGSYQYQRRK